MEPQFDADPTGHGIHDREAPLVRRLFGGLRLAPLGTAEGERAGTWRRDLAAQSVTVNQAACLIAAAAVGIDADLATENPADFPDADDTTPALARGASDVRAGTRYRLGDRSHAAADGDH